MTFEQFQTSFLEWSENHIEAKKDDGFTVCPFARRARLKNKIQFLDGRNFHELATVIQNFDKHTFEIGIAWLGDVSAEDIDEVEMLLEYLSEKHTDLLYFTSTRTSGYFVKNFTDCVFIQLRDDINEKREHLRTTDYYASWPTEYLNKILSS